MALSDVQLLDFLSRMPFIDTVLVVADSLTYSAPEARRVLADAAPEAFLTVTCGPLVDNEQASFRLYRGATPEDPVGGMFSFFPRNASARGRRVSSSTDRPSGRVFQPEELAGSKGSSATAHQ